MTIIVVAKIVREVVVCCAGASALNRGKAAPVANGSNRASESLFFCAGNINSRLTSKSLRGPFGDWPVCEKAIGDGVAFFGVSGVVSHPCVGEEILYVQRTEKKDE